MAFRIETHYKVPDARSVSRRGFFNSLVGLGKVSKVTIVDVYTVDAKLNQKQIQKAAALLTNPLLESYQIINSSKTLTPTLSQREREKKANFDYAIEISFLPGVTDNVAHTTKETLADGIKYKFKESENVYSSQVLFLSGQLSRGDANKIAGALHNPLIQKAV